MGPDISIIIPTYNRVDLLTRAFYSVQDQTFEDWELLIVDDCSTDRTHIAVSSWARCDSRVISRITVIWELTDTQSSETKMRIM